jgi:hypothetical protein
VYSNYLETRLLRFDFILTSYMASILLFLSTLVKNQETNLIIKSCIMKKILLAVFSAGIFTVANAQVKDTVAIKDLEKPKPKTDWKKLDSVIGLMIIL